VARLGQVTFGIRAELRQVKKELDTLKQKMSRTARSTAGMTDTLRNLQSASVLAVGPLSGIGARITALGTITNRSTIALAAMVGVVTLFGVVLGKLSSSTVQATLAIDKIMAGLIVATGSTKAAKEEFDFLAETSLRLGVDLASSATEYAKLAAAAKGSKLEGEEVRKVFTAISEAAVGLRLSNDQVAGAFRALQQMMSKGTVQSEEIRGQFGERIPGAFRLAAKAMGVTTQQLGKMLEQGQVLTDDFMPKFARVIHEEFEQAAVKASKSLQASLSRLSTTWLLLRKEIDETLGVSDSFQGIVDSLIGGLRALNRNLERTVIVVGTVSAAMAVFAISPAVVKGLILLATLIRRVAVSLVVLGAVAATATTGLAGTLILLAKFAAAIGAGALAMHLLEKALKEIPDEADDLSKTIKELTKIQTGFASSTGKAAKKVQNLVLELAELENIRTIVTAITPEASNMSKEFQEAFKIMRNIPDKEMLAIGQGMLEAGIKGDSFTHALVNLIVRIRDLKKELKDLTAQPTGAVVRMTEAFGDLDKAIPIEGAKQFRKAFQEAGAIIREVEGDVAAFDRAVADIRSKEAFGLLTTEQAVEGIKLLREALFGIALPARQAALAMAQIETDIGDADAAARKHVKELNIQIKTLRRTAEATDKGTQALENLQRALASEEEARRQEQVLRDLGIETGSVAAKMRELEAAQLLANNAAIEAAKKFTVQAVTFQNLADTISSGMAQWIVDGKEFSLVLKDIINDLARMAVRAAIANNIMANLFGFTPAPVSTGLPTSPVGGTPGIGGGPASTPTMALNRAAVTTPIQALQAQRGVGGRTRGGGDTFIVNVNAPNSTPGSEIRITQAIRNMGDSTYRRTIRAIAASRARGGR